MDGDAEERFDIDVAIAKEGDKFSVNFEVKWVDAQDFLLWLDGEGPVDAVLAALEKHFAE